MRRKGLERLLFVHGWVTLAAGLVLIARPQFIPSTVGIHLEANTYLLAYLLAGTELGFAVLSFGGSRLADRAALRLIVWSCIALHGSSASMEVYTYIRGGNIAILGNVAARIIIVGLFTSALSGLKSTAALS
jgi:hypothetical protein